MIYSYHRNVHVSMKIFVCYKDLSNCSFISCSKILWYRPSYLSSSVILEESLNPLAKGLLSIFSLVI